MRALAATLAATLLAAMSWAAPALAQEDGVLQYRGMEVRAADYNPQVCLTFSSDMEEGVPDWTPYVQAEPPVTLSARVDGGALCLSGFEFSRSYALTLRQNLPNAADDMSPARLAADVTETVEIPDRAPFVMFRESGNVLPRFDGMDTELGLPLRTVNVDKLKMKVMRIGDRGLAAALHDGSWKEALEGYSVDSFDSNNAETVWEGTMTVPAGTAKNTEGVTAFPVSALPQPLRPGIYVAVAWADTGKEADRDSNSYYDEEYYRPRATQWFTVSDLGLTAFTGSDGVTVFARGLGDAEPVRGVDMMLIAANNDVLGTAETDRDGKAVFAEGLLRGKGGARPVMVQAFAGGEGGDFAFLELEGSAIDLSDRGVSGRAKPGPLDPFIFTERGIYRPGEQIPVTVVLRDDAARLTPALAGLPLTLVLSRPDGVEAQRASLTMSAGGSAQARFDLPENAFTGTWTMALWRDPNDRSSSIGMASVQVEDFMPPRLEMTLTPSAPRVVLGEDYAADEPVATLAVQADYLYGAPAANLTGELALTVRPAAKPFPDFADYSFGRVEEEQLPVRLDGQVFYTDDAGHADVPVVLEALPAGTKPSEIMANVSVFDVSGRPLTRAVTMPLVQAPLAIGLKPGNAGGYWERGQEADFQVVALDGEGKRRDAAGLTWTLYSEEVDYHWFQRDGRWDYETTTDEQLVTTGKLDVAAGAPAALALRPDSGQYRVDVEDPATGAASSYRFYAGWYASASTRDTERPDRVEVRTDKASYRAGETAQVFIKPPSDSAVLLVVAERGIKDVRLLDIDAEGETVSIEVSEDWAAGAYVLATAYTPAGAGDRLLPRRSVGVAWLQLDPQQRELAVSLDAVETTPSQTVLPVTLNLGAPEGDAPAEVVLAAVDDGILQITGFKAPDPLSYFMSQRSLDVTMRDLYGRLIDPSGAAMGEVRSGGDGGAGNQLTNLPKKQEKLVAYLSPVLQVPADGILRHDVQLPRFAGRVRLMAVTWSGNRFGHAERTVTVRDPYSAYLAMPRFLAPGDMAEAVVQMELGDAPAGSYRAEVTSSSPAVRVERGELTFADAQPNATARQSLILHGGDIGDAEMTLALTAPDGTTWSRSWTLSTRAASPAIYTRDTGALAAGATLTVDDDLAANMIPGSAKISVSVSSLPDLGLPQVLQALDRYPYGCVEQTTSRAMPLLYVNDVETLLGLKTDKAVAGRLDGAIDRILGMQNASGSFGMWGPSYGGSRWLSAYALEFLVRAKEQGYAVPASALNKGLSWLQSEATSGGYEDAQRPEQAYVLYVLARAGRGMLAETRYFAETYQASLPTEISRAQLGYALALLGDDRRADAAFASIGDSRVQLVGLNDYGTPIRDRAAAIALMAESGRVPLDRLSELAEMLSSLPEQRYLSTQEDAWLVMAAQALGKLSGPVSLEVDGAPQQAIGTYAATLEAGAARALTNTGRKPLYRTVSIAGVPTVPEPAVADGMTLSRSVYAIDGTPLNTDTVDQHTTLVVVLEGEVTSSDYVQRQLLVADLLPAGIELENMRLTETGATGDLSWLGELTSPTHVELRDDRYVAAFDISTYSDNRRFRTAYVARAVTPGRFVQPPAQVEDMYSPQVQARTEAGRIAIRAAQ